MTIIPIHPSIVGLIFAVVNGLIEIACLKAMYKVLALYECRQWRAKNSISIRGHSRCHTILTMLAFVMFIVSETLVSINTDVFYDPKYEEGSCVKTVAGVFEPRNNSVAKTGITFRCMQKKGCTFSVRTGQYNTLNGSVVCDNKVAYRYHANSSSNRSISGAVRECSEFTCVFVFAKKNEVSISGLHIKSEVDENAKIPFFTTEVFFDVKGQLKKIAKTAFHVYFQQVSDTFEIREEIFLKEKSTCRFLKKHTVFTDIPSNVLWCALAFWIVLLLLFIFMRFNKKYIFYDITNVSDWARKTYQSSGNTTEENTQFIYVNVNDKKRMFLTDSQQLDYSVIESEMECESEMSGMSDHYA